MRLPVIILLASLALAAPLITPHNDAQARSGCCSRHGGVRGCACADGTPLSAKCAPYYPQCAAGSGPAAAAANDSGSAPATKPSQAPAKPRAKSNKSTQEVTGKVVRVADGDTVTVLGPGNVQYKIRLNGVDSPESKMDFGTRAKQFTSEMVFGKTVRAVIHETDKYGRHVADIWVGDKCLNKELVRAGMAWHYKQYSNDPELAQLEQEARAERRGLWGQGKSPVAPWDWRRQQKKSR
jgi:endonuclease YncB( thermonuclease family)